MTLTSDTNETTSLPVFPPVRPSSCPFDPPAQFAGWRTGQGLQRCRWRGVDVWVVSRYDDIKAALSDPRISADTLGKLQSGMEGEGVSIPVFPRMDDPEHNRIRRMLMKDFTVKRVNGLRPEIQAITDGCLDRMIEKGAPADLVQDFALPVPSLVISALLGVPYESHEFFQEHSQTMVQMEDEEAGGKATFALFCYMQELIAKKHQEPGEDLLSRVIREHVDTGDLDDNLLAANAILILSAGHETTANMLALSTLYLLENPELADRLRTSDDPVFISKATVELFRYLTVVTSLVERIALEDVEIGGQLVHAGEGLIMNLPSGNRDSAFLGTPDTFDVDHQNQAHVAFGFGTHQCMGQILARAEVEIALPALLCRLPSLRSAVPLEQLRFRSDMGIFGVHEFPVVW